MSSQVTMIESETGASLPKLCRAATWSPHTWRCSEIFGWFLPRFGPKQLGVTCFGEKLNWFTDLVHVIHVIYVIDISFCLQSYHIPPFPLHVAVTGQSGDCMCMCTHDDASSASISFERGSPFGKFGIPRSNDQIEKFWSFSFPETNIASEHNRPSQKEISIDLIFQPFIFRGELLVSGKVNWHFDIKVVWCSCSSQVHPARKIPTSMRYARPWRMATMATFDLQIWSFVAFQWWKARLKTVTFSSEKVA